MVVNVTTPSLLVVWIPRRNVCAAWLPYCEKLPAASHCQISTCAFSTGPQLLFVLTTVIMRVSVVPPLPSRISLRIRSVSDGDGPIVSVGVTAHAAFVVLPPVVVPPVVVVGLASVSSPHPAIRAAPAAPSIARASRRPIRPDSGRDHDDNGTPTQPQHNVNTEVWRSGRSRGS